MCSGAHSADCCGHEVVPPHVAAVGHRDVVRGAAQHEHLLDRRALGHRGVGRLLERHDAAAAPGAVAGDEHLGLGVLDPVAERVGGEAAEHHRVRRADARAREERRRQLRHHAEVDVDPVALADAELLQRVGEPADVVEQLRVGDGAGVAGLALPVVRDLVAVPGLDVAVEAVVRGVELPADEPLREREIPVEDRVPVLVPVEEVAGLPGPEALEVDVRLVVDLGVDDERRPSVNSAGGGNVRPSASRDSIVSVIRDPRWRSRNLRVTSRRGQATTWVAGRRAARSSRVSGPGTRGPGARRARRDRAARPPR